MRFGSDHVPVDDFADVYPCWCVCVCVCVVDVERSRVFASRAAVATLCVPAGVSPDGCLSDRSLQ